MNQTVALALIGAALIAAGWSSVCAISSPAGPRWRAWPTTVTIGLGVGVAAWIVGGSARWLFGDGAPARPVVFAGYAATAVALIAIGVPASDRLGGRSAHLARAVTLVLLAFCCWRAESVWLFGRA